MLMVLSPHTLIEKLRYLLKKLNQSIDLSNFLKFHTEERIQRTKEKRK